LEHCRDPLCELSRNADFRVGDLAGWKTRCYLARKLDWFRGFKALSLVSGNSLRMKRLFNLLLVLASTLFWLPLLTVLALLVRLGKTHTFVTGYEMGPTRLGKSSRAAMISGARASRPQRVINPRPLQNF